MSFSDWLLALHLIAAFALMAALMLFTAVMVASWAASGCGGLAGALVTRDFCAPAA